jgi:hypothetical protein
MFPRISRRGVVSVFFRLFIVLGPSFILDIRRIETVIKAIKAMQHSGRLIFGTNLDKPPAPIMVKKLLLMLIAAGILECQHVLTPNCDVGAKEYDLVALGLATIGEDGTILGLHEDSFCHRLPLIVLS